MCVTTAGRVTEIRSSDGFVTLRVTFESAPEQVCLSYIDGVELGDFVLVTGGAVVERVTEEEAAERAILAEALLDALAELAPAPGGSAQ